MDLILKQLHEEIQVWYVCMNVQLALQELTQGFAVEIVLHNFKIMQAQVIYRSLFSAATYTNYPGQLLQGSFLL